LHQSGKSEIFAKLKFKSLFPEVQENNEKAKLEVQENNEKAKLEQQLLSKVPPHDIHNKTCAIPIQQHQGRISSLVRNISNAD